MITSTETVLADNNQMPWFFPYPHETWWLTRDMWNVAVDAIKSGLDHTANPGNDLRAFCMLKTTSLLVGAGDFGRKEIEREKPDEFAYLDMPWSKRVAVITPDVLVLVQVRLPGRWTIRKSVKRWLDKQGIQSTYTPDTNDMLINNKKFMGTQIFQSPKGYETEFGIMTMYKDAELFDAVLPEKFKKNARGHEITGICNEVGDFKAEEALPSLYRIAKGKEI